MLDAIARNRFHHVSLELLRPKVGKRLWERVAESASEHDDELCGGQYDVEHAKSRVAPMRNAPRRGRRVRRGVPRADTRSITYCNVWVVGKDIVVRR